MTSKKQEIWVIVISIVTGSILITYWLLYDPVKDYTTNMPGMDNRPDSLSNYIEKVDIGESFEIYDSITNSNTSSSWTRFRGQDFDNIVKQKTKLLDKFPENGPKILWQVKLGEGHAAPAVQNSKVYILDYLEDEKADALRCFDLITGKELWQRKYKVHIKRNHGISRTIPAINENYIVTIGPKGHVMCNNPETGELLWGLDMIKEYGTEIPFWYTGQCPIIDANIAVLAPGGSSLLVGIDCATGQVAWQTPNPNNYGMSHSSVMPMKLDGKKTYVYAGIGGICGVSAEMENMGKMLWTYEGFAPNVVAPSPLVLDDNTIIMTAGYGAGAVVFDIYKDENGNYQSKTISEYKPKEGIASEQQTPILFEDHVFTILPKDAGGNRNQFVCSSKDDCTSLLWTSGKKERFGLGPYIIADGKFFILKDDGTLTIAKATTKGFQLLDKYKIMDGHDAWGPLAIIDGLLLMRDSKTMICVDIRKI